jgi:hypothetical protein
MSLELFKKQVGEQSVAEQIYRAQAREREGQAA